MGRLSRLMPIQRTSAQLNQRHKSKDYADSSALQEKCKLRFPDADPCKNYECDYSHMTTPAIAAAMELILVCL